MSDTLLQVGWPSSYKDEPLLYPLEVLTEGPFSCRTNSSLNPLDLEVGLLPPPPTQMNTAAIRYRRVYLALEEHLRQM